MNRSERRERRCRMASAVREGQELAEVAKAYGVSVGMLRRACREFGVPVARQRATKVNVFAILKALLDGQTRRAVAESLGISRQRVQQVAEEARAACWKLPRTRE
jgi:transposase